jgi:hypothetical protein
MYDDYEGIYEIKNNNIVMESPGAFPIHMSYITWMSYDIDNNNLYAPNYVGYADENKTTLAAWQQTITTDTRSMRVSPVFTNPATSLELADYSEFYTDPITDVTHDITKLLRFGGITALGCYHGLISYNVNASLFGLLGWREGVIHGEQDTIKMILFNGGSTPLTIAQIGWSYNNIAQPVVPTWQGNLALGSSDTVVLGVLTYSMSGDYTLSAWINNLGGLQDEFSGDDTVSIQSHVCGLPLSGVYAIGSTGAFPNLSEALKRLMLCGASGDIVFEIQTGNYSQSIDLSDISSVLGNNKLTITSATHNADDVVLVTSSIGVILSNSNNIVLKDITIDATQGYYAVQFTGSCSNVVIRDCKLLTNTTTTSNTIAPVYKETGTGIVDSIFIINNLLDGGYYGFYFYGGIGTGSESGKYGTNVVFDSNTISNQSNYGIYSWYVDFTSCSNNVFLSRTSATSANWQAMRMIRNNGTVMGNRILQRSTAIISPSGMFFASYNYYNTLDTGLVANNEIIINTTSSNSNISGIQMESSHIKILHNSIYISGTGATRGISILPATISDWYEIKNNNIVMTSSNAYPVYLSNVSYLSQCDIDNNNMYAPNYVGYAGGNKTTITDWQQTVTSDQHSMSILPSFIDSTQHLKLTDYTGLECPIPSLVKNDLKGIFRVGNFTTMGAYHGLPFLSVNASLTEVINLREGAVYGQTDNITVVLYNTGATPLTTATIAWEFNGVSQTPAPWSGNLAYGQSSLVNLGAATYDVGDNTLQAWIDNLGGLTDVYPTDDTLKVKREVCFAPMSGTYTIGTTSIYTSITDALNRLKLCGANADVVFEMETGTYNESLNLSEISNYLGGNKLTITSATHDAEDVIIQPVSEKIGIILSKSNNIVIKDITVDAIAGNYAIQFTGPCTNVVIRDCKLLTNPVTNDITVASVYKETGTGVIDSIFIIHNLLDGGYYGCYFHGGTGTSAYGTHVVFDSNTVSNQYHMGTFFYYTDFTSYSYNTILSRTANSYTEWYGIRMDNNNGPIISNRIIQYDLNITRPCGMYLYYHNHDNTTDTALLANNEIILHITDYSFAIRVLYSYLKILHNSIYVSGSIVARGIQMQGVADEWYEIKNNNIVMTFPDAYPIDIPISHLNQYDVDYNNLYAPTYVGYAGGNKTTIADWQQTVTSDKHSVSVLPLFVNTAVNLELSAINGLLDRKSVV